MADEKKTDKTTDKEVSEQSVQKPTYASVSKEAESKNDNKSFFQRAKEAVSGNKPLRFDESRVPFKQAFKDVVSLELTKPVITRVKNRLNEIKKFSTAKHVKIQRGNAKMHLTEPPQYYIARLEPKMVSPNKGIITYDLYATDDNGQKKRREVWGEKDGKNVLIDVQYPIEKTVVETFEQGKLMTVEYLDATNPFGDRE